MSKDYSTLGEDSTKWARNLLASVKDMDDENVGDEDLLAKAISKKTINRELNAEEFKDYVEDRYGEEKREELRTVLGRYRRGSRLPTKFELKTAKTSTSKWENNWSAGFGFGDKEE